MLKHLLLASLATAAVIPIGGEHAFRQPNSKEPVTHPARPLVWGDFNVLHTTDTHGWLAGHLLEANFGADWGDFVTFGQLLRQKAREENRDLIVVDTGDRHDGNGLADASDPTGVYAERIFNYGDYDLVTIGNHELYRGHIGLQDRKIVGKHFGERYVVSNVEVLDPTNEWVSMGHKFRNFTTEGGRRVLGLGFLFDFDGNDKIVFKVTPVVSEIQKQWFQDVLQTIEYFDAVVIIGHIPVRDSPEFPLLFDAIRKAHPTIPILMFGGHSHIRDFKVYDKNAAALEAGRYCETIGWASVDLEDVGDDGLSFSRSYIDFNTNSLAFHAGVPNDKFTSHLGRQASSDITGARASLNLDQRLACIPQTYYTDRAPFPSSKSIYTLFEDHILNLLEPSLVDRSNVPRYTLLNTGAVRFDMFKGHYTKDSGYIVSPFANKWVYIKRLPKHVADGILPVINQEDKVVASHTRMLSQVVSEEAHAESVHSKGYHTFDDLGDEGDDTKHIPWKFYPLPNAIQAKRNVTDTTTHVDLVFHDFMAPFVAKALKKLGHQQAFKVEPYGGKHIIELIPMHFGSPSSEHCP